MDTRQLTHFIQSQLGRGALLSLVRSHAPAADLHQEIRHALAMHVLNGRTRYTTWQDAWNDLTGARPGQAGILRVTPNRCPDCKGKRFVLDRHMGRFGACLTCHANGRGRPVALTALYAEPPAAEHPETGQDA